MSYEWSYAPTNRATCKGACKEKIEKGAIRFSTTSPDGMVAYRNLACVTDKQIQNVITAVGGLDKVPGFDSLSVVDQSKVLARTLGAGDAAAKASPKREAKAKAKAEASPKAAGTKRKAPEPSQKDQHEFLDLAKNRDFKGVEAAIQATPELINVQPAGRWAALHQFAEAAMAEAVTFLLKNGADIGVKTKDGKTPLDVATGACKSLLEKAEAEAAEAEATPEPASSSRAAAKAKAEPEAPKAAPASPSRAPAKAKATATAEGSPAKKAKTGKQVDPAVPGRENYSVVGDWSALLNQTNVGANNNKYYRIQVLEAAGKHFCWTHWGRVGASGQNKLEPCGSESHAQAAFKKKFREKSGVAHDNADTHDWTPTVGKYTLVKTDDAEGEGGEGGDAPLGKLSVDQIEKGQAVLKKLEAALRDESDTTTMMDLSGQYYTLIPHDFGFAAMSSFTINSNQKLEKEMEMLKFFLRMGFEEMDQVDDGLSPVSGIMQMERPPSLEAACSKLCSAADIKASNAKGKQHAGKQSGSPSKKMDESLYGAIMLYTSNAIYKDLNNVLRSEDRGKIKKYFAYLRLLLEALGSFSKQNKTLWRGIGLDLYDQYKLGAEVTWWGCSSCTADINVAKNFMKGCGGKCTLLTIQSKTAADISAITFFGNEKENLLAPGTKMKVLKCEREGKVTNITMEEIGRVLD